MQHWPAARFEEEDVFAARQTFIQSSKFCDQLLGGDLTLIQCSLAIQSSEIEAKPLIREQEVRDWTLLSTLDNRNNNSSIERHHRPWASKWLIKQRRYLSFWYCEYKLFTVIFNKTRWKQALSLSPSSALSLHCLQSQDGRGKRQISAQLDNRKEQQQQRFIHSFGDALTLPVLPRCCRTVAHHHRTEENSADSSFQIELVDEKVDENSCWKQTQGTTHERKCSLLLWRRRRRRRWQQQPQLLLFLNQKNSWRMPKKMWWELPK